MAVVSGIHVTPRVETVADLAAVMDFAGVLAVLQDEVFHGRMTVEEVAARCGRGRDGSPVLHEATSHLLAGRESILSVMVYDIAIAAGFPEPDCGPEVVQYVGGCDLVWRAARTIVEPRGYGPHGQRRQWERDTDKVERLQDEDWHHIVVRHQHATRQQGLVANRISRTLAAAGLIPARLSLPPHAVLVPRWAR